MGELLLYALVTFFSAYGIFSFLFFLKDFSMERKYLKGKCLYTLVFVKDEACNAELMTDALLFQLFKNDTGLCERKIVLVDTGSSDSTYETLETLFRNEKSVIVTKEDENWKKLKKI
ncbi:MAG: hypothetical protein J6A61_07610 [Clostridia bacterium]|nr:hypothetical protein [Clostridia bacterium]